MIDPNTSKMWVLQSQMTDLRKENKKLREVIEAMKEYLKHGSHLPSDTYIHVVELIRKLKE